MNVRELLQIEIWSRRTSWKICIGIGLFIGVSLLALGARDLVERYWLTPGERSAARAALAEIDSLDDAEPLSDQVWQTRKQSAKAKVEATAKAARTYRDTFLEMDLGLYFLKVETDHLNLRRRLDGKQEVPVDSVFNGSTNDIRLRLHKELD